MIAFPVRLNFEARQTIGRQLLTSASVQASQSRQLGNGAVGHHPLPGRARKSRCGPAAPVPPPLQNHHYKQFASRRLRGILEQLLCHRDYDRPYDKDLDAEDLARSWFNNKEAQTRAAELLGQFQMDEGALEAEAFRSCSEDVERLDRMLTALEFRRDKALRSVTDYQQSLSKQLQQAADRILENDEVPRLVSRSG